MKLVKTLLLTMPMICGVVSPLLAEPAGKDDTKPPTAADAKAKAVPAKPRAISRFLESIHVLPATTVTLPTKPAAGQKPVLLPASAVDAKPMPPGRPTTLVAVSQPAELPAAEIPPAPPVPPLMPAAALPPAACPVAEPAGVSSGFYAGATLYFLKPYSAGNTAYQTTTGFGGASPATTTRDFDWGMEPAYEFTLGYAGPAGLGAKVSWFRFDQSSAALADALAPAAATATNIALSPSLPAFQAPSKDSIFSSPGLLLSSGLGTDRLRVQSALKIDTLDAAATYTWDADSFRFSVGAGGRYLHLAQRFDARIDNALGDGVTAETQTYSFTQSFNGGGPLLDLGATWRVGQTNWGVFSNVRGALLVGQTTQESRYYQRVTDPLGRTNGGFFPVDSTIAPTTRNVTDTVVPMADLQLGLEYGRPVGAGTVFGRVGVVNQTYFGVGGASRTDGNLSLFGVQFSAGFNY